MTTSSLADPSAGDSAARARAGRWVHDRTGVERLVSRVLRRATAFTDDERQRIRAVLDAAPIH